MFFMAQAALLTKKLTPLSHKALLSLFGEDFVKTGIFDRQIGKWLHDALDKDWWETMP